MIVIVIILCVVISFVILRKKGLILKNLGAEIKKFDGKSFEEQIKNFEEWFEKNDRICIVCGEMNPNFYNLLDEKLKSVLERNKQIIFVGGPRIALRDKDFSETKANERWKKHTVTKYAVEGVTMKNGKTNKIVLYYSNPRQTHHFVIGDKTNTCLLEASHKELEERTSFISRKNWLVASALRIELKKILNSNNVKRWDISNPGNIEFVPCSNFSKNTTNSG